ncbi:AMP-binding protein [Actinospica durhamensis]|uniref:AMP-binding protein n=1 Tax=Actinospica durhamensis TaxID=1508375 RepID=A0A941EMB6_9ACTN|nr:AMP-binding protein [Actinospica durhamensis]MBR7835040.1 AMP-binding protein [Actinospica durhamensis]
MSAEPNSALDGFVPWPEEFADRYRRAGYWRGEVLGSLLRAPARRDGARTALVEGERRWTYAELDAAADRRAAGLAELGLARGDRVLVQLPNSAEFIVLCFALFRLGAVPVFALPGHRRSEIAYLCELSEAVCYVVPDVYEGFDHRELAREVAAGYAGLKHVLVFGDPAEFRALERIEAEPRAWPDPDPAEPALLLLSGGTTGLPKLIARTHDDYMYNIRASVEVTGLDQGTTYLVVLPVAHNFALGCPGWLGALSVVGTVVLAADPSPARVFPLIARERVDTVALVPPLALLWADAAGAAGADLSSLRLIQVGGAKLAEPAAYRVAGVFGCVLQQVFGMAEGLLNFTALSDPAELVAGCQGRPLSPADEVLVLDPQGRPVPDGEVGELLTRGPYTLRGYYRAPEHNLRAFTEDGFYRTGDLVRRRPDATLVVEGRIKDQINRGGEKIAAAEVEGHLAAHPAVREAALVAVPDPVLGERAWAFLTLRGPAPRLPEIRRFLAERGLAGYKAPDRLEVVESWPVTGVGKIDKRELAALALERSAARRAAGAGGAPDRPATQNKDTDKGESDHG